ncbi:hypothetical protein GDO78_016261 [Eleutherodactylus coqui]|uniref:Uncharacterized protein n=1 Tax=Eleutherodactylus coqui TaxID=57060 RepID=A0A8J6EL60_ELECQ|nr:hypothetical protein GDO78_016261 [Eleutherodactylus coqui]
MRLDFSMKRKSFYPTLDLLPFPEHLLWFPASPRVGVTGLHFHSCEWLKKTSAKVQKTCAKTACVIPALYYQKLLSCQYLAQNYIGGQSAVSVLFFYFWTYQEPNPKKK